MKRIIALFTALLLITVALTSCKKAGDAPDGMKLASHEDKANYFLYVPDDWTIDLQTGATTVHVSSQDLSSVSVTTWLLEHTDDTVDTWYESQRDVLNMGFTDFAEESVRETTVDGVYAKEYTYTAKLGGNERKYRQVAAVKSGTVYVISYSTTPELFDEHSSDFDDILTEFRFK